MKNVPIKDFPRVLVISHNSFSSYKNNGKTLCSIFRDWPSDKIAQLYFYPEKPFRSISNKHYRITDKDIMYSLLFNSKSCGSEVSDEGLEYADDDLLKTDANNSGIYKFASTYRNNLFLLIRDLLWSTGKWQTEYLNNWLDAFNPEIIFFVGSESGFSYDIAFRIAEDRNLPFFLYCTDDYITPKFTLSPFFWIKYLKITKRFRKAIRIAKRIFVIGEIMADEYSKKYGGVYTVLMNMMEIGPLRPKSFDHRDKNKNIELISIGNLGLKRWRSLLHIGQCLSKLRKYGLCGKLTIYTSVPPQRRILKILSTQSSIQYRGSIESNGNTLAALLKNADVLVHVDGFSRESRHIARLSLSTKIPEYFAAGRCVLAYGPEDIGSIQYLKKYDAALVACNKDELMAKLKAVLEDSDLRTEMGARAYNMAQTKHERINIVDYLYQ